MLFSKLISNQLTLEYTKGEITLMLISGILLIILNYFMITGLQPQHSARHQVEIVRMNR